MNPDSFLILQLLEKLHARMTKGEVAGAPGVKIPRFYLVSFQFLGLLLQNFARTRRRKPLPFANHLPGFVAYLRDKRGLCPAKLINYRHLEGNLNDITVTSLRDHGRYGLGTGVMEGFRTQGRARYCPFQNMLAKNRYGYQFPIGDT
jgi:hypothetical protein